MWKTINLGALPVVQIQRCLGIELAPGILEFSADAQAHAFKKVPTRESICKPHLFDVVARPTHVGQQPKYVGTAFELVRVVPDGPIVLIAIGLAQTRSRAYGVRSVYPLDRGTLERRVRIETCVVI